MTPRKLLTLGKGRLKVGKRDENFLINQGLTSIVVPYPWQNESASVNANKNDSRLGILINRGKVGIDIYKLLIYIYIILPFTIPFSLPFHYPSIPSESQYAI